MSVADLDPATSQLQSSGTGAVRQVGDPAHQHGDAVSEFAGVLCHRSKEDLRGGALH